MRKHRPIEPQVRKIELRLIEAAKITICKNMLSSKSDIAYQSVAYNIRLFI